VRVEGIITDADGIPPAAAFIVALSLEDYSTSDYTTSDETGYYQLEVPGNNDSILLVIPISGQVVEGYNLHGYRVELDRLEAGSGEIVRDFTLIPCHDFILEAYDADGELMLNDKWPGLRFVEDMAGNAINEFFIGINKGEDTPEVPGTCVALGKLRRFFIQLELPDFGNVMLAADNSGAGYIAEETGGTVLNLSYELARTQINRLRDNLNAYQTDGYDVPPAVAGNLAEDESLLAQAAAQNGAARAALSDKAASVALWALESLELARAEQDIPRYRQGNLAVTVLDESGDPLPGAAVVYTQTSNDFLFGIFDTLENAGIEGYELMQQAGINYLTTGSYWSETEPEQDEIAWEYIDHAVGVMDLAQMGATLKSHALMAFWDFGTPEYLKAMSFAGLLNTLKRCPLMNLIRKFMNT
jgi:hypothetical protein